MNLPLQNISIDWTQDLYSETSQNVWDDLPWPDVSKKNRCSRCLYPDDMPVITFDERGVCNYCHTHDAMEKEYPTGAEGQRRLEDMVKKIREEGRGKKYDCIIGVSGGCDSSYLIYKMKEMGLRPLAAHFDNTWNSSIATDNINRVLKNLDVDLFTIVVNNKEYDDIYLSFLKSGVPDLEAPTDIGLAVTLYRAAEKYNVGTMIEGHAFRTEGISPLGWLYMDGQYIRSIHQQYGTRPSKTYPHMPLHLFLKWMLINRVRKIRPLYWMDYQKEEAKQLLNSKFGWRWYGGHHLENRFTAFYHSYFLPRRWGIDGRLLGYAALVRSGQLSREEGLQLICEKPKCSPDTLELVKKRLGLSDQKFEDLMTMPKHHYTEFKTYKKTFERLRPFFWTMYKLDMVPKSFYMKYCAS